MKYAALLLLSFLFHPTALRAQSTEGAIPSEWLVCEKSEDCIYVINSKSCATAAVNKKFTAEANQYISTIEGDGRAVGMDNGSPRCLNQPEAWCAEHVCKLMVHPE